MPYIIDGHNLIPKIQGLSLENIDDEAELIKLLKTFCIRRRKRVEVFFDRAPAGFATTKVHGPVTAHFVSQPQIADNAIRNYLRRLGRRARNWIVVSSDHAVQLSAHAARAQFISSEDFSEQMLQALREPGDEPETENALSEDELKHWLELFEKRHPGENELGD